MSKQTHPTGEVIEALAGGRFRVVMDETKHEVIAYLSGKMRISNVRVGISDKVAVILDPAGGKASNRIVWRF